MPVPKKTRKANLTEEERQKIHDFFSENGINFSEWARERGFNVRIFFTVLHENRKCTHGESFKIAKALKEFCFQ